MSERYSETRDEVADFMKSSSRIAGGIDFLVQYGLWRLDFGMHCWKLVDKKPSFDPAIRPPPYPYNEKNLYVNASNNLWQSSMWRLYPSLNELYYSLLLDKIREFRNRKSNFDFNKGIVYANLGVAQSIQMKLDEGFANILKALIEDSPYSGTSPEYNLHRRDLFTQFEIQYVKGPLVNIMRKLGVLGTSAVDSFLDALFNSLNDNQRAFLDYTIARIAQNLEIWKEKENSFTSNRLLAYTQDFCLFNEDLLKSKFSQTELGTRPHWELRNLVEGKFTGINLDRCSAKDMSELDTNLPSELGNPNLSEKGFRILLMLRNYSSHNVGGGNSRNCFYNRYDEVLAELVRAFYDIALLPMPP